MYRRQFYFNNVESNSQELVVILLAEKLLQVKNISYIMFCNLIFTILQAQVLIYNVISVGKLQVPSGSNKKDLIDLEFDLKCKNDMINFPQCDECGKSS